jgi:hypothetical protein
VVVASQNSSTTSGWNRKANRIPQNPQEVKKRKKKEKKTLLFTFIQKPILSFKTEERNSRYELHI